MQNPSAIPSSSSSIHALGESASSAGTQSTSPESLATELRNKIKGISSDVQEKTETWIQNQSGKTLGVVGLLGVAAAAGALGYFLGKNAASSSAESPAEEPWNPSEAA